MACAIRIPLTEKPDKLLPASIFATNQISEASMDGATVKCKSCGSDNLNKFKGELALHFLGLKDLQKPIVWVYPEVSVRMSCGSAEFVVPESELSALAKGAPTEANDG